MTSQGPQHPTVYELIEFVHADTPGHRMFVVDCDVYPCSTVGNPHPFTTAPPERGWNQPGECFLCGESSSHANHEGERRVMNDTYERHLHNLNLKWRPRDDRIVVLPLLAANPSMDGVIVLPSDTNRERPMNGIVLAVGPGGVGPETGREIPVKAKPGELVAFGRYAGMEFEVSGPKGQTKVLVMRDCEVLLAREPDSYTLITHEDNPAKMHEEGFVCDLCAPPTVDLDQLKRAAYAAPETSEAESSAAPAIDEAEEARARGAIEAERQRLREQRDGATAR
jgi:co-chaperonin GroES (HSP10)